MDNAALLTLLRICQVVLRVVSLAVCLFLEQDPAEHGVVLVLGCTEWQRKLLKKEIARTYPEVPCVPPAEGTAAAGPGEHAQERAPQGATGEAPGPDGPHERPDVPLEVNNEVSAPDREELYRTQACLFVTTRILVVDMLNNRIQPRQIAGILVVNAHRVTDTSGEGFAVRLYRASNSSGFVRAFSDQPVSFSGFSKVTLRPSAPPSVRLSVSRLSHGANCSHWPEAGGGLG
jgi:hypothetical protein